MSQGAKPFIPRRAAMVLAAGLLISGACGYGLWSYESYQVRKEVRLLGERYASALFLRLALLEEIVHSLRILKIGSEDITEEEFRAVSFHQLDKHSGIQALEWVQVVKAAEREEIERRHGVVFTERGVDGGLVPAGRREEHLAILYAQPLEGNEEAVGFDLSMGPTRAQLSAARDSGGVEVSPVVTLVQGGGKEAVIFILPIYSGRTIPESVEQRRRLLTGYMQGVFLVEDLVASALGTMPRSASIVDIVELGAGGARHPVFSGCPHGGEVGVVLEAWSQSIPFKNRYVDWELTVTPSRSFIATQMKFLALSVGSAGVLVSFLVAGYIGLLTRQSERVQRLVDERTEALRRINIELEGEVAERKQREEHLLQSESRYRSLFDLSTTGIAILDGDRFMLSNKACRDMFGYGGGERLEGHVLSEFLDDEAMEAMRRVLSGEDAPKEAGGESQIRFRLPDGGAKMVEVLASPVVWADREARQVLFIDATERQRRAENQRQLERQINEAQKLESLGVMAGGIAHDFNNLLTGIMGNASFLQEKEPEGSETREMIDDILEASERAADLCRQMLAYSGKGKVQTQRVDMGGIVTGILKLLEHSISKKATVELDLEEGVPLVEGDATQLRQVAMNLVINASEALDDKPGRIGVAVRQADHVVLGRSVMLEVSDDGTGMDEAVQRKIFEPFFTTKFAGRGLGLSAVTGIVRSHHGRLEVDSAPGRGTVFRMYLPAVEAERGEEGNPRSDAAWTGGGCVLLVDDESILRKLGSQMLGGLGFDVLLASDGREGLDVYSRNRDRISLVLLDLTMPEMDGIEVMQRLRAIDPGVRIILTSGFIEEEVAGRIRDDEIAGFLQKPFSLDRIRSLLKSVLEDGGTKR